MKKLLCIILVICTLVSLAACGGNPQEINTAGFKPALDAGTSCRITVAGSYDNFEALEAEFDRFNEIYPNVQLSYVKLDDYNNMLSTVLESNDKPNIFFSYAWMIGNEQYDPVFAHMEDLSDAALGLNLDCIRPGLLNHDAEGRVLQVPVFSRTYGMLVNEDLFEKEGLGVPATWTELMDVCEAFRSKGYASPMMGYSIKPDASLMNTVAYPLFTAALAENPDALALANQLAPAAGEYMRPALEAVEQLIRNGCVDLAECDKIEDNYTQVILRFFEGDVPMMTASGDTVSGTEKRESRSESFIANPFTYTFVPIPMSDDGANFLDMPNLQFSVNKDSKNLDMANEFMRFLITPTELNEMAQKKGLMSPTKDLSFNSMYAAFGAVPESRILSPEVFGLTDDAVIQLRQAVYGVGTGTMTLEEAIAGYGTFTQ